MIFIPRLPYHPDFRYTPRDDRYPPYDLLVADSPRTAFIISRHPALEERLRQELAAHMIQWAEKRIGDYTGVLRPIRTCTPGRPGPGPGDRMTKPQHFSIIQFFPRLNTILFAAVFFGFVALGPKAMNGDGDLGRHLTIGGYILDHRQVPTQDLFSHTMAGEPLIPHEWLAQVLFALAYRLLGLDGVVLLSALVVAATFSFLLRETLKNSPVLLVGAGFTILAVFTSGLHWLTRPHLLTFLMVVLWVAGLERLRRGNFRFWWTLPVLMVLWANLHGAFIAGFMLWGMYAAGYLYDRFILAGEVSLPPRYGRFLLVSGATAWLATLINPAGLRLWANSLGYISNSYLTGITNEYLSPDFHKISSWPFLIMIVLSLLLLGLAKVRLPAVHVFMLAGWMAMGLVSARNIPLYALVAAPILAGATGAWISQVSRAAPFMAMNQRLMAIEQAPLYFPWSILVVVLIALALRGGIPLDYKQAGNQFDPAVFPVAGVSWMEAHPPQGNVFNYFTWGGYLLYRMWPSETVFIDGQTDFYGEALTRQYAQVIDLAPGWQDVLAQYHIRWVIMPAGAPLVGALEKMPGWRTAYRDQTAAVIFYGQ